MTATGQKKRGRGRPKAFDRGRVVDAAMRLLWQRGPGLLSVNELCATLGISKPSLYREFGGEDGLLAAALAQYEAQRTTPLLAQLCRDRPLAQSVGKLADWLTTPSPFPAGCLLAKSRSVLQPLGPLARSQVEAMRHAQLATLTQWLEAAARRGELAEGVDPDLAARYVDTQLTTLLMLMANQEPPALIEAQTWLAFAGVMRAGT